MNDTLQQAIDRAYSEGCYLIEIEVGNRKKFLLTTKSGHRIRSFEVGDVAGIMKCLDYRRRLLDRKTAKKPTK